MGKVKRFYREVIKNIMCLPERYPEKGRHMRKSRFKRLSHTLYEGKYHIVFCPKYRYRILTGDIAEYCKQQLYILCRQKDGVEILELNVQPDHIHLVMDAPPKYCISTVMGYHKGKMALKMFQRYERLGKAYWWRHLWSRGYCMSTVGLNEEQIRKYVQWQEKQQRAIESKQMSLF